MSEQEPPPPGTAFGGFAPPDASASFGPPSTPVVPPPTPAAPPTTIAPGWQPWMAIVVPLLAIGGLFLLSAIVIGAASALQGKLVDTDPLSSGLQIVLLAAQDVAFIGAAIAGAWMFTRPKAWHFGWRPTAVRPAVLWAAATLAANFAFAAIWLTALGKTSEKDHIAQDLGADKSTALAIVVAFLVCVAAPVVEETFFRGAIFGSLRSRLPLWAAATITGLVFGAAHAGSSPIAFVVPLALFGALLALLYHRTRSLYPSMGVHAVNNSIAIVGALGWAGWLIPVVIVCSLTCVGALALTVQRLSGTVPADAPSP